MSRPGDLFVQCCSRLHPVPSFLLCLVLVVLQACTVDYYLVDHLSLHHLAWVAGDIVVLVFVVICFRATFSSNLTNTHNYAFVWITWAVMQALLAAKIIVISSTFGGELDEDASFFGPNTLKTAIALGGCIFLLILSSQHEAPPNSERRAFINDLSEGVVVDILDATDILDVLFSGYQRPRLDTGIPEFILVVATLNLLLPTISLFTLSKTKFGLKRFSKRSVYLHRLLLVLVANVPNLVIRMILWHGYSVGVSPFTLKNIIDIVLTAHRFYEHKKLKYDKHRKEAEHSGENGNGKTNAIFDRKTESGDNNIVNDREGEINEEIPLN